MTAPVPCPVFLFCSLDFVVLTRLGPTTSSPLACCVLGLIFWPPVDFGATSAQQIKLGQAVLPRPYNCDPTEICRRDGAAKKGARATELSGGEKEMDKTQQALAASRESCQGKDEQIAELKKRPQQQMQRRSTKYTSNQSVARESPKRNRRVATQSPKRNRRVRNNNKREIEERDEQLNILQRGKEEVEEKLQRVYNNYKLNNQANRRKKRCDRNPKQIMETAHGFIPGYNGWEGFPAILATGREFACDNWLYDIIQKRLSVSCSFRLH